MNKLFAPRCNETKVSTIDKAIISAYIIHSIQKPKRIYKNCNVKDLQIRGMNERKKIGHQ